MNPVDPGAALVEHHLGGIGPAAWGELRATLRALTGVPRVLLLTGDWTASRLDGAAEGAAEEGAGEEGAGDVVHRLRDGTLVSIAVLRGTITGEALRLALACTLRVAAPGTVLRVDDVVDGRVPPEDVLVALRTALGEAGALELAVTGRPMDQREAAARGLLLPGGETDARDLAAAILSAPDDAVRATLAALRRAEHEQGPRMLQH